MKREERASREAQVAYKEALGSLLASLGVLTVVYTPPSLPGYVNRGVYRFLASLGVYTVVYTRFLASLGVQRWYIRLLASLGVQGWYIRLLASLGVYHGGIHLPPASLLPASLLG